MIREDINKIIDEVHPSVEAIEEQKSALEISKDYTEEYKNKMNQKLNESLNSIHTEVSNKIRAIAEKEIERLMPGANPNSEMATANILKMMDMTKDTMTQESLQEILNKNTTDALVVSAALSISQSKNINIDKPIDKSTIILQSTNDLINKINTEGLNSLGTSLALNYLPE